MGMDAKELFAEGPEWVVWYRAVAETLAERIGDGGMGS
jgi:hypothetical protein